LNQSKNKTVAVFTATRAEFGILSPLVRALGKDAELDHYLFVGGTHLAPEHGRTIDEIMGNGFTVTDTFDYLLNRDDSFTLSRSTGLAVFELSHIFQNYQFDFVCILGDRFEVLSVVINAILFKKPIIHISGGEKTEGLIDEQIRHMITKAAHLHFASCKEYGKNIRRMGEPAWRIHNTGSLNVDNMARAEKASKQKLYSDLGLYPGKRIALMTYHPVTLEYYISPGQQIKNVFDALKPFELQVVITGPNIEVDREKIISFIKHKAAENRDIHFFESLGMKQYHRLIPHCEFVIGNSSSGITEAPYFKIPSVNIGDRQNGRIRHNSVLDTGYSVESVKSGIERALSAEFRSSLGNMHFKFGDGHAAERMVTIIKGIAIDQELMRKKLEFEGT